MAYARRPCAPQCMQIPCAAAGGVVPNIDAVSTVPRLCRIGWQAGSRRRRQSPNQSAINVGDWQIKPLCRGRSAVGCAVNVPTRRVLVYILCSVLPPAARVVTFRKCMRKLGAPAPPPLVRMGRCAGEVEQGRATNRYIYI